MIYHLNSPFHLPMECWWRDSNPHCTDFESVASYRCATPAYVRGGIRTRTVQILSLLPPTDCATRTCVRQSEGRTFRLSSAPCVDRTRLRRIMSSLHSPDC